MNRYDTPLQVAQVLARHVPKGACSILDPCIGTGVLLEPLAKHIKSSAKRVVCIDVNSDVLRQVKPKLKTLYGRQLQILNTDFLDWSAPTHSRGGQERFDCVVMNPPFAGRQSDCIRLDLAKEIPGIGKGIRFVPLEGAFILRGIRMLHAGGCLLSIVPSSLISSLKTTWFRKYLLQLGAVRYVHELPRFTFRNVEARVYLFVFEKLAKQRSIILCNHDLLKPERIALACTALSQEVRFDYSFHRALRWYNTLRCGRPNLGWTTLKQIAHVIRGSVNSPSGARSAFHTCDYHDGFWHPRDRIMRFRRDRSDRGIQPDDLLIKRVGRNCGRAIGKVIGNVGTAGSDCLLIIRPKKSQMSTPILFMLRVLIASPEGAALLERGTGATYLSASQLLDFFVPMKLILCYPSEFAEYRRAVARKEFRSMTSIENRVRELLYQETQASSLKARSVYGGRQ